MIHTEMFTDKMVSEVYFRVFQRWKKGTEGTDKTRLATSCLLKLDDSYM